MKRKKLYSWASPLLLSIIALNACTKADLITKSEDAPAASVALAGRASTSRTANGGGTFIDEGFRSTFTFNASKTGNAPATGKLNYQFRSGAFQIQGDVNGLEITGNKAKVIGKITQVKGIVPADYSFVKTGKDFYFIVQDNGSGKPTDLVSDFVVYTNTTTIAVAPTYELDGNIQIK